MAAIDSNSIPADLPEHQVQKPQNRFKLWLQKAQSRFFRDTSATDVKYAEKTTEAGPVVHERISLPHILFTKNIASFSVQQTIPEIVTEVKKGYAEIIAAERQKMEFNHGLSEEQKLSSRLSLNRREDRVENARPDQLTGPIVESINILISSRELPTEDLHKLILVRNKINDSIRNKD